MARASSALRSGHWGMGLGSPTGFTATLVLVDVHLLRGSFVEDRLRGPDKFRSWCQALLTGLIAEMYTTPVCGIELVEYGGLSKRHACPVSKTFHFLAVS